MLRCCQTRHRASLRSAKPCKHCARQLPQGAVHNAARHACRPQVGEWQGGCASPDTSPSCSDAARAAGARPVPSSCAAAASPPSTCRASRRSPASPGNNRQSTKQRNQSYCQPIAAAAPPPQGCLPPPAPAFGSTMPPRQGRRPPAATAITSLIGQSLSVGPHLGMETRGPLLLVHESGHMVLCIR